MDKQQLILTSRTLAMQRIADHVCHGYSEYCCGAVSPEKCVKLIRKFKLLYYIDADRNIRARHKRQHLGNAVLVMWYRQADRVIYWWLLVTPKSAGEHPAHANEQLRDALNPESRLQIDGFDLVRLPKPTNKNVSQRTVGKEVSSLTRWTWRMSTQKYEDWRHSVIDTVRTGSSSAMHSLLYRLWSSPGFGGIRSQIGKITALYRSEVKRANRRDAPVPPKKLYYVRRLKVVGLSPDQVLVQSRQE